MANETAAKNTPNTQGTSSRKTWIYVFCVLFLLAGFAYYSLVNRGADYINHDFYRVLYEASNRFNENLNSLQSMHKTLESEESIRALMPSYSRTKNTHSASDNYQLSGQTISIVASDYSATLDLQDLLPPTREGFSQFLFADRMGKVIASTGGEKTVSIVEMTSINQQLLTQSHQSLLNFDPSGDNSANGSKAPLPTYSSHVDMSLSFGEFRIFIFPFNLSIPLTVALKDSTDSTVDQLYLVGLLPKSALESKGSGHWNISLLIVTCVSLLFMWALLRLILLPENHSITRFYRVLSQVANYAFYVVLVALVLSYLTQSGLRSYKNQQAQNYAESLVSQLNQDLYQVFSLLASYRSFYTEVITGLDKVKPIPKDKLTEKQREQAQIKTELASAPKDSLQFWEYEQLNLLFNRALDKLASSLYEYCKQCDYQQPLPSILSSATWHTAISNNYQSQPWTSSVQQDRHIAKNAEYNQQRIFLKSVEQLAVVNFYAGFLLGDFEHKDDVFNTRISREAEKVGRQSPLLSVFATDEKGYANLPAIYYQEANSAPQAFSLIHRDYFKKVRDFRGWQLRFNEHELQPDQAMLDEQNVYIQRLLNLNDGTRGTTISMPMFKRNSPGPQNPQVAGYVLGADVILPSLSLAPPSEFDFTFMVVDRNSGQVLFHTDEERSLVENLFYAGESQSSVGQWIKAGLDQNTAPGNNQLSGFYHGEAGLFTLLPTKIDAWAMVVFSPDDSLNSYLTNQFLYIFITFTLLLSGLFFTFKYSAKMTWMGQFKARWGYARSLDLKRIMLIFTALITANYCLFYLGELLKMSFGQQNLAWFFSPLIPLLGLALLGRIILSFYWRHFKPTASHDDTQPVVSTARFKTGAYLLIAGLLFVALLHFVYLQYSASMPIKSLQYYYHQQYCHGVNKEKSELTDMALNRYPNSVTHNRISPYTLLPLESAWKDQLRGDFSHFAQQCQNQLSVVEPEDFPKLSTLIGTTFVWKWINTYLIEATFDKQVLSRELISSKPEITRILLALLILVSLIWVWFYFNRKILWPRIYCPNGFLQHIAQLCRFASQVDHEQPSNKLLIQVDSIKLSGVGLALLLRDQQRDKADTTRQDVLPLFSDLYHLSPCLQQFSAANTLLPNLKIDLALQADSQLLEVRIWDIETCLEKTDFRQCLLDLIMEIKSLTLAGKLHSFTIYSGFRSLRRVKMKDPLSSQPGSLLEHAEYMSWSECLMDFLVVVDERLFRQTDPKILCKEVANVPELRFLQEKLPMSCRQLNATKSPDSTGFWQQDTSTIAEREWATIHYILLHADALYRFKWESCSSAERLALYNLAKQHRLNPANTEMIEHLAINGMLKVSDEHLALINKSFSHFVLHAETRSTLDKLVEEGEAGIWKSYRLPLGMLIILIIGGIALTSGQSIFIIAASLAGVLGTIGSLTTSASLLKGQLKD